MKNCTLPENQLSELRKQDTDSRWQEVTDEDLQEYWDVHPFLDSEGFRYYIPAFMIWCIRHYNSSDLATGQWTLSSLWLEPEKLKILNSAQCKAIVEFLKFAVDTFDEFDSKDEKKLPQYNQETMETNIDGLYLAGVICGGMETHKWFIENSRIHAPMIIDSIVEKTKLRH